MIYNIILLLIIMFSFIELGIRNKTIVKMLLFLLYLILLFGASIRYNVGPDESTYRDLWNGYNLLVEPLFYFLMDLIKKLFNNVQILFFACALISLSFKFSFIKKYSPYCLLSIAIYFVSNFLMQDIIAIRQGIAVAFVLWAFDAFLCKKKLKFCISFAIAVGFHISAVVVFLILILTKKRDLSFMKILRNLFVGIIAIVLFKNNLINILYNVVYVLPDEYKGKFVSYMSLSYENVASAGVYYTIIMHAVLLLFSAYHCEHLIDKYSEFDKLAFFIKIYYYGVMILLLTPFVPGSDRLASYFLISNMIILPMIIKSVSKISKISFMMLLTPLLFILLNLTVFKIPGMIPYNTILK